jgi:RyR domain
VETAAKRRITGRQVLGWNPNPVDTTNVSLPDDLLELIELLSENAHDNWAQLRISEGWRYGPRRDEKKLTNPLLVPYAELSNSEKDCDRRLAIETLKVIIKLGYQVLLTTT